MGQFRTQQYISGQHSTAVVPKVAQGCTKAVSNFDQFTSTEFILCIVCVKNIKMKETSTKRLNHHIKKPC